MSLVVATLLVVLCLLPFAALYWLARKYPEAEMLVPQESDIDALIEKLSTQPVDYSPSPKYIGSPPSRPVPDNVVQLHVGSQRK